MILPDEALATLTSWSPPDGRQASLREEYVELLRRRPDGCRRTCLPRHLTVSLLVLDRDLTGVLLTLHAKSGRWFQFGGHLEPGDPSLVAGALREGREESGLAPGDLAVDPDPLLLDAHDVPFCGPDGARHLDVMFAATAPTGAHPETSAESLDVAWFAVDELPDPELVPFVTRAVRRLRAGARP